MRARAFAALATALVGVAAHAQGRTQVTGLGSLAFPVSTERPGAQRAFVRGVLLLHLFEYPEAASAFREAERLDPDLAMAYWGEAMTYDHPIWNEQDARAGRAALAKLAARSDGRAQAPTARERAYLTAVGVLYGDGSKPHRDTLYARAMERVVRANPSDDEARLFYALSLLGLGEGVRDERTYLRAAVIAESVFARNPDNPGAAHYLIHAVDDPEHAAVGRAAASALAQSSPLADHAQHMTSHIFIAMGMWEDVVRANETAVRVMNAMLQRRNRGPRFCRHYNVWLDYGYVEEGRLAEAARLLARCRAQGAGARDTSESGVLDLQSFLTMWSNYLLATGDWTDSVAHWTIDPGPALGARLTYGFTRALGALHEGDRALADSASRAFTDAARATEAWVAGSGDPSLARQEAERARVLERELLGLIAAREGRDDEEVAALGEATVIEDSMAYAFGPPFVNEPAHELFGAELLRLKRSREAETQFQLALKRTPRRSVTLLGLARAAQAAGDTLTAGQAYGTLVTIWQRADPELTGASEAQDYVRRHGARPSPAGPGGAHVPRKDGRSHPQ